MSDEFIELKGIGRDRRKKQLRGFGRKVLTGSKAFGKGFAETARSTAKAFTGGSQQEQIARLKGQEAKLKLKLKVSRQRTKLTRLRRKAGVGFEGFRNFATKVSKTRIAQGELGGTVFKGKRRKRNDFLF